MGDLRFAAPVAPTGRNTEVQNGSFSPVCPQAGPGWLTVGEEFAAAFAAGNATAFNYTAAAAAASAAAASAPPYMPSPQETEDCLFLDVMVPKNIFDSANSSAGSNTLRRRQWEHWNRRSTSGGAPVLLW